MSQSKILLNRSEIAEAYGVSTRQIQSWEASMAFPNVRIGGRVLYCPEACKEWHRQFMVGGVPEKAGA